MNVLKILIKKSKEKDIKYASAFELMKWKFFKHKMAVISMIYLILAYFVMLFSEFFIPNDPFQYDVKYTLAPPTKLHFEDDEGKFVLRPFIYGLKKKMNFKYMLMEFEEDTSRKYYFSFFSRGFDYYLLGLFKTNIHFFGVEKGGIFFPIGADQMGRCVLSRTIYASRISLTIGLAGIAVSFLLGLLLGSIAAYKRGLVDDLIQRLIEAFQCIPTLPLWMGLGAAIPATLSIPMTYFIMVLILSLVGWTELARVVRGRFLTLLNEDYVTSARLHGSGEVRIFIQHLIPSMTSHIIASLTLSIPGMILAETALSFLGLGIREPAVSWGVLLNTAQNINVLVNSSWQIFPALFVVLTVLAYNFLGDGMRDAADPYSKV